jgi:anti-sigma regulatory factor (Ser/Thr protein kinase)
MQTDQRRGWTGRDGDGDDGSADVRALRALCRRQAWAIDTMTRVSRELRTGLRALKAENAELRRASGLGRASVGACAERGSDDWLEMRVPVDVRAPGAARRLVAQVLGDRVAAPVLERAKLVISELVSNSVCHSGVPAAGGVAVRVRVFEGGFWLEVEDPGRDGVVAQRAGRPAGQGGLGLVIVQALSECWGSECVDGGGTRVWAQLSDTAPSTGRDFGELGEATLRGVASGRETRRPRDRPAGGSSPVHVVPRPRSATWSVYVDAVAAPLSEHTSETEAESAARAHALTSGASEIVVHDRYHRTHARLARAGAATCRG